MSLRNLTFERQKPVPVFYKAVQVDCGFRLDFIVESRVVLELKAVNSLIPLYEAQVLTYLKLTGCSIGLLMNFNTTRLTNGLKRIILTP